MNNMNNTIPAVVHFYIVGLQNVQLRRQSPVAPPPHYWPGPGRGCGRGGDGISGPHLWHPTRKLGHLQNFPWRDHRFGFHGGNNYNCWHHPRQSLAYRRRRQRRGEHFVPTYIKVSKSLNCIYLSHNSCRQEDPVAAWGRQDAREMRAQVSPLRRPGALAHVWNEAAKWGVEFIIALLAVQLLSPSYYGFS